MYEWPLVTQSQPQLDKEHLTRNVHFPELLGDVNNTGLEEMTPYLETPSRVIKGLP